MTQTRREAAMALAEELLEDIELSKLPAPDLARKVSRLARLLDDVEALAWLQFEISGYPTPMSEESIVAAKRSGRQAPPEKGSTGNRYWTKTLGGLQSDVDISSLQIQAAVDGNRSVTSANPHQIVQAPPGNGNERMSLRNLIVQQQETIEKIIGALHGYVAEREIELRFGAAVESAFMLVRNEVDARIAKLAPAAATKLSAAFENASSGNPEHWANAASACRRLLKEIADELRPPGPPVNGRDMTDDKYINRLVDWISSQPSIGKTLGEVVTTDLDDFGKRIDAFDDAGHKGAHAEVTQYEASRFITGAYLLIGDILNLWDEVNAAAIFELDADDFGTSKGVDADEFAAVDDAPTSDA